MNSVGRSHGSLSQLFVMKVESSDTFVSNSHKVTATLIVTLPFQIVVCGERFLCNFMDISSLFSFSNCCLWREISLQFYGYILFFFCHEGASLLVALV
jgi:hypothetical protein